LSYPGCHRDLVGLKFKKIQKYKIILDYCVERLDWANFNLPFAKRGDVPVHIACVTGCISEHAKLEILPGPKNLHILSILGQLSAILPKGFNLIIFTARSLAKEDRAYNYLFTSIYKTSERTKTFCTNISLSNTNTR
jgi:hypothetical protein